MSSAYKGIARIVKPLLAAVFISASLAACDSNDDNDGMEGPDEGPDMPVMGTGTLDQLLAQGEDGEPANDGLDQVEADLLTRFGSEDGTPFPVSDTDTVQTLLGN